jgi:pimeloyl-ACP methyl ester carboxylesterase
MGFNFTGMTIGLGHTAPSSTQRKRWGVALIAACLAAVPIAAVEVRAEPKVYLAPFYANTSKLNPEGQPLGKVLAAEPTVSTVPGSKAWRIAYVSSDGDNRRTVVTALIAVPDAPAPSGGRRLLAWAHGTTGTARRCGPSQMEQPAQPLNQILLPSGTSWSDFGLPAMEPLIQKGYVIVATDYQGLGGAGDHQYAQTVSNGRDVINALRAARDFKPAQAGEKAIVYGWSQGGGATIGAAGQEAYAKSQDGVASINILGFVAMAPEDIGIQMPTGITTEAEAAKLIEAFNTQMGGNVFNFTHLMMFYWGLAAADPRLNLGDLLTPQATSQINGIMRRKCIHELSASFSYSYGNSYKQMLKAAPNNALNWVKAIQKQSPGLKPMAPVVIYWGNQDDVVPPVMHKLYFEAACKQGAVMSRNELPGNNTHFSTPAASEPFYVKWIDDRFNGKPLLNGCPNT